MELDLYLAEFAADWRLAGKAATTADTYCTYLRQLVAGTALEDVGLAAVKVWLAAAPSPETARHRARAVRAFGRWSVFNDGPPWTWWNVVPLVSTPARPQPTVCQADYRAALAAAASLRDRLVVELLWSTGMRVSEVAKIRVEDVDLRGGYVVIPRSKTGKPRIAPLSESAIRLCRRHMGSRVDGTLLQMSAHAIQLLLRRLGAPTAHAWRRGWAVQALRNGVSEASVRAAAGWSSGAMVARYTSAVSGELALVEFQRARSIT